MYVYFITVKYDKYYFLCTKMINNSLLEVIY
nr:hypothetical protein TDPV-156 [Oriental turtle dovepox virus]